MCVDNSRKYCLFIFFLDIPSVNLDSLLIQLRPQVATDWYQFGQAAGIEIDVLKGFSRNCSPEECIVETLDYWLRNSTKTLTWMDIVGVLKLIKHSQLASDIEKVYTTGKHCMKMICKLNVS